MTTILISILLLADIITYIVFFDVILSWLMLFWLKVRPQFIADILDPMYIKIKDTIPTTIWPLDLTPIIIIFLMMIVQWFVVAYDPSIAAYYRDLISF